ncbi:MAG: hypothetical protein AAF648_17780, partial [Pseudomonadota bacterium]
SREGVNPWVIALSLIKGGRWHQTRETPVFFWYFSMAALNAASYSEPVPCKQQKSCLTAPKSQQIRCIFARVSIIMRRSEA